MMRIEMKTPKREVWIDNLRCASILAVIILHSVSHTQYKIGGGGTSG